MTDITNKIKKITVIGAGTMGTGVSQVFALHGNEVTLVDDDREVLAKAHGLISSNLDRIVQKEKISALESGEAIKRIQTTTSIKKAMEVCDLMVEAVPEHAGLKCEIFKSADSAAPGKTIFASNTSSISITLLASCTDRPDKCIGMHFFNPVPVMKLVEVIRGMKTSDQTVKKVCETARSLDKVPILVNDSPGFVSNRVLMPMINEAIFAVYEGVASPEAVDEVMKLGMAHPMGPLRLADFIGLDVCLDILRVLYEEFGDPKYRPCPLLVKMVVAGKLGNKTGQGFFTYD